MLTTQGNFPMMPIMSKEKPANRNEDRHLGRKVQFFITDENLERRLDAYLEEADPETSISAIMRSALKMFLDSKMRE